MTRSAVIFGAVLLAGAPPCLIAARAEGFILPTAQEEAPFRQKADKYEKALALVQDRGAWEAALAKASGRTGLAVPAPGRPFAVRVALQTSGYTGNFNFLAHAAWFGAQGEVGVAMDPLAEMLQGSGGYSGGFGATMAHELTHVLQGYLGGEEFYANPPWLVEGMADYAADVHDWEAYYRATYPFVPALYDGLTYQGNAAYMRGTLFFRFLEGHCGLEGVKAFVHEAVFNKLPYQAAAGKACNEDWKTLAVLEQRWAQDYIQAVPAAPQGAAAPAPGVLPRAVRTGLSMEEACRNELAMFCPTEPPKGRAPCLKRNKEGLMRDCRAALRSRP